MRDYRLALLADHRQGRRDCVRLRRQLKRVADQLSLAEERFEEITAELSRELRRYGPLEHAGRLYESEVRRDGCLGVRTSSIDAYLVREVVP